MYQLLRPISKIKDKDLVPIELIDKEEIIERIFNMHQQKAKENLSYINSYGNKNLDNRLIKTEKAKEMTQKKYRKDFYKKKEVDAHN